MGDRPLTPQRRVRGVPLSLGPLWFMLQGNWVEEKHFFPFQHLFCTGGHRSFCTCIWICWQQKIIYFSNLWKFLSIRGQLVSPSLCLLLPALLCKVSRLVAAERGSKGWKLLGQLAWLRSSDLGSERSFSLYHLAGFCPQPVEWVLDISYHYGLGILLIYSRIYIVYIEYIYYYYGLEIRLTKLPAAVEA